MGKLARQFKVRAGRAQGKVQDIYNRQQTSSRIKKFGDLIGGLAQNKIRLDQVSKMRDVLKRQALTASERLSQEDLDPMERFMYEQQLQNVDLLNANLNINTVGNFFNDALAVNKALDPSGLIQAQMNLEATNRWRDVNVELKRQSQETRNYLARLQGKKIDEEIKQQQLDNEATERIINQVRSGSFSITPNQSNPITKGTRFFGFPSFLKGVADSGS